MSALIFLVQILIRDGKPKQSLLWLLLLVVVFALTGVVVVPRQGTPPGRQTERFPCENCPCGCSTAEFCWDQCCCHTDREKLQWAERNGVSPPDFLIARVARSSDSVAQSAKPSCCHCGSKPERTCHTASSDDATGRKSVDSKGPVAIVIWKAAECRGIKCLWTLLAAVYVSPAYRFDGFDPPCLGWITLADQRAMLLVNCPEPPVP